MQWLDSVLRYLATSSMLHQIDWTTNLDKQLHIQPATLQIYAESKLEAAKLVIIMLLKSTMRVKKIPHEVF